MARPGSYKRRFERRAVSLPVLVRFAGREVSAVAENISPAGAFFRVKLPPDTQQIVASIELPHGKDLRVRAHVCWRRDEPPGVGVHFDRFLEPKVAGPMTAF